MQPFNVSLTVLVVAVILDSCSSVSRSPEYSLPEYKEDVSISFDIMTDELLGFEFIRDICQYKSYIVIVAVNLKDRRLIHVFDKETGECLADVLNQGRGPGEYLYDRDCHFDTSTGEMRIYDYFKNSIIEFHLDSLMRYGAKAVKELHYAEDIYALEKTLDYEDKHFVFRNESFLHRDSDVARFTLTNATGDTLSVYNSYPEIENDGVRWQIYQSCNLSASPSYDRIVACCIYSGILETFSLSGGQIRNIATGYFSRPDFHWDGGLIYTDITTAGFGDVFAAEDRIYTVFDGETKLNDYYERPKGKTGSPLLRDVCIFDWSCRPVKRIRTDYQIDRICIDEDADVLYAVVKDSQGRSYLGRINL